MRSFKKFLAMALSVTMLTGLLTVGVSAADFSDLPASHWAYSYINDLVDKGIMVGNGDGTIAPDRVLTRAEYFVLLNKAFGYTGESTGTWIDKAVSAATAAGYYSPEGEAFQNTGIPRSEMAELGYSVLRKEGVITAADTSVSFTDVAPDNEAILTLAAKGILSGPGGIGGPFKPNNTMTRAEAAVIISKMIAAGSEPASQDVTVNGTSYSDAVVEGNLTIVNPGTTVENVTVKGNLIIAESVGEGDVYMKDVLVAGDALVLGGGKNSLYFADFRVEGSLIVRKYEGENTVRIVVSGESNFSAIVLETGAIIVTQELADGVKINVEIPADYLEGSKFEFIGDFDNIVNNGDKADIKVTGTVNKLTLNASATVSGTGRIAIAEVSAEAGKDTVFSKRPVSLTGDGRNDVKMPSASSGGSSGGSRGGSGGGGSGGGSGGGAENKTVASVAPITETVTQGAAFTLPSDVSATLTDGGTQSFSVIWTPDTASAANVGTFDFEGALIMTEGYANPDDIKAALTLNVTPALESIAVTPPAELLYVEGEDINLAGMVVRGTYSDGAVADIPSTDYEVTGYDKTSVGTQTVTVTSGGKSASFDVTVFRAVSGDLVSIASPSALTVSNGAAKTQAGLNLPSRVIITVNDGSNDVETLAHVAWDVSSANYDAGLKTAQTFDIAGTVTLPEGVANPGGIGLDGGAIITVTVPAAVYTVTFDLNGRPGTAIRAQRISHGEKIAEPSEPVSAPYIFDGWFKDAACTSAWNFAADTVTADTTLYVKWFIDETTLAAAALTFDVIGGSNKNEQSILTNLALPTSLTDYPGVSISWQSSKPAVISTGGTVTRPASNAADEEVTLTATLTQGDRSQTKVFNLMVRREGTTGVEITSADPRFAPGYPVVSIGADGTATVKVKLVAGAATPENPVVAYYAMDGVNTHEKLAFFDKESILAGHLVEKDDPTDTAWAYRGAIDEYVITDSLEHTFDSGGALMDNEPISIGIVLLKNDDLNDPVATPTLILMTAEQAGYVDTAPPTDQAAVFSKDGTKIYAYFNEKITNTTFNASDFTLDGTSVTVSSATVGQNPATRSPHPSWAVLTLSGAVPAGDQSSVVITYNSSSNPVADANSNKAQVVTWHGIVPGAQSITASINPAQGTLCVEYHPSIWSATWGGANVTLKKGSTVIPVTYKSYTYANNGSNMKGYFTFNPDSPGSSYTVDVAGGMTAFADSPFDSISAHPVDKTLPAIATNGIAASLSGNEITLTLPAGTELGGSSSALGCAFILNVDGKRVLVRGTEARGESSGNIVRIRLNDRRSAIVSNGTTVTIAYDPNQGGHDQSVSYYLSDISGAFVPAFGPVTIN